MAQPSYAREWVIFSESPSIKLEVATDESFSEPGIKRVGVRTQFLGKVQEMALKNGFDQTQFDIKFNCQNETFRHIGEYLMFREGKQVKGEQVKS